jgi:hypothetical protein
VNSYYARKLREGQDYEQFVAEKLRAFGWVVGLYKTKQEQRDIGESRMGLEIKFDDMMSSTKNVYFETHEKSDAGNAHFVESGILRADNSILYGIGNRRDFYMFGKFTMQRVREAFIRGMVADIVKRDYQERETPTSKGFTLKRYLADCYAERIFRSNEAGEWYEPRVVAASFRIDDLFIQQREEHR